MEDSDNLVEKLIRQAFGLLLEIRGGPHACRLLREVVVFLTTVTSGRRSRGPAMVLSVGLVQLPESPASLDPQPDPPLRP
jgi:hypothetical protein